MLSNHTYGYHARGNYLYSIKPTSEGRTMLLPLLNEKGEYRMLDVEEIVYLQTDGAGEVSIYSYEDKYRAISMVRDWYQLLQNSGFWQLDRGTVVNRKSIQSFDPELNVIAIRTNSGEIFIPISQKMQKEIRAQFPVVQAKL